MVGKFIIPAIKERCAALDDELATLRARLFPSQGPTPILDLVERASKTILKKVEEIENSDDVASLLTQEQIEHRLYRVSQLLPYLHMFLSFLQGAERNGISFPFALPIRRLIRTYIPECEVVFVSRPELNYSFDEIATDINTVFAKVGLDNVCQDFPRYFLIISFPQVEAQNILLHCIFAHEIGHGIYLSENVADRILDKVKINKEKIRKLSKALHREIQRKSGGVSQQLSLYTQEIQIRDALTEEINSSAGRWADELTSDAIAVALFGPAYFFAHIHFTTSFQLLDISSVSHPSSKLRLRLMSKMMQSLGFTNHLAPQLKDYFHDWTSVANSEIRMTNPILEIVSKGFEEVLVEIIREGVQVVSNPYGAERYRKDMESLPELIKAGILPIEVITDFEKRKLQTQDIISILNAGWVVYLCGLEEFAETRNMGSTLMASPLKVKRRLQEEISKALELQEIKTRWDEVCNA